MTVRYRVSDAAQDDLLEIWNYVFQFHESDRRADRILDSLYETFAVPTPKTRNGRSPEATPVRSGWRAWARRTT